jgi:hypothetical protein
VQIVGCVNIFFHWVELIGVPPAVHPEVHPKVRGTLVSDALTQIQTLVRSYSRKKEFVLDKVTYSPFLYY